MHVLLETDRLTLRQFTPGDVELLVELDSDPEVMRYLSGGAPTSRDAIASRILPSFIAASEEHEGLGYWAALDRPSGDFVGWFALHPVDGDPRELRLGYRLRRSAWGRGLATEGARALLAAGFARGAERISAGTYQDNTASRRVLEKVGMRFVRTFKVTDEALTSGTFDPDPSAHFDGDDVEYAITREAWLATH